MTLTPFAQMVIDATDVEFRYPTPSTPSPPIANVKAQRQKPHTKPKSQPSQRPATIEEAYDPNSTITVEIPNAKPASHFATPPRPSPARPKSTIEVVIPRTPNTFQRGEYTPSQPPRKAPAPQVEQVVQSQTSALPSATKGPSIAPSRSNPNLAVVIPDPPPTFRPQDYEVLPDSPNTPQHLSRKRQRSELDGDEDEMSRSVDQREKADSAFRNLRDYLLEIFEAEDQVQLETFSSNQYFTVANDGMTLTKTAQTKVESLLQKIISFGRFSQAPLDDLLRLQKLCEGALKDVETMDVRVDDTMGESEVDALLHQIPYAELGVRAARTSLRLMSGGREDKQLYSEDVIQAALNAFKNISENCIIPIVEMRGSGSSSALFKLLSAQKKPIIDLLTQCRRLLSLLTNLIGTVELSETVINTLEFTASQLIFVENAHSERDSVLGVAKFDSLRVVAMDALAQIFQCNPNQRQGIFDEILTSLEKLPVTKQSARQFKLAEGGSIQLVSALIMRLIQTSASKSDEAKAKRRRKALEALNNDEDGDEEPVQNGNQLRATINSELRAEQQAVTAIQELKDVVSPLLESANKMAIYVVGFIVTRAMTSTKSGDAPYRNLLDLFVEDFITCLNSTDWPAAELLLRLFLFKMVHLAEGDKTSAPAKNMALDLLGLMGAAISELNSHVRKSAVSIENGDSGLGGYLSRLAEASLEKKALASDLVSWPCGPFRASLEFLDERCSGDPQLSSGIGFLMAQWASKIYTTFDLINEDDSEHERTEREYGRLAYRLRNMISDRRWLSTEYSFDAISVPHARLAYSLTLLNSQFCESFGRVLTILLGSMTSEQATVRSKSLKSVNQVLDTDPTIIDRETAVKLLILRCSNDSSVQVRDSALGLIGKCISLRPALENEMLQSILQRVSDSGIGVRKRAMKLAKDIYLRNSNPEVRSSIADHLLHRVTDLDEGVQELARQTIEEVWMSPFYQPTSSDNASAQFKLAMTDHVALMIKTVQRSSGVSAVLDKVLQNMLSNDSKFAAANFRVCKALVATMFETIIDNSADGGNEATTAREALQILTIFAKSNAKLFTPEQIHLLQPYIANVKDGDDMAIFRSVVVIFRHVLPYLSKVHNVFLASIRKELMQAVARFTKSVLEDVIACLWIISGVLDDFQHLTRLVISSLKGIQQCKGANLEGGSPAKETMVKKVCKLLMITGIFGKYCDLDSQRETFRATFTSWKGDSVSKLMSDTFAPFALVGQPLDVRKAALDAIGMVCQSWPKNFPSANIKTTFKEVFQSKTTELETIIMRSFKEFLLLEEKRSEAGTEGLPGAAADPTAKLGVMGGGQGDGIALGIAQEYLEFILSIALRSQDEHALLATEVIASITRQGLVHPKVCGTTLIALETSQNPKIAEVAFREHRASHEKHETILEKEYMRAVQMAYTYQRDVVQNTHGATLNPYTSKLHMMIEILKISKVKNRKRFYDNLCARIDFDPAKMDIVKDLPHHLEFSQFIIENMAFFEYATVDELLSAITAMEKVVAATGTGIAHAIETEVFHVSLDQPSQIDENGQSHPIEATTDPIRLQQLTASSMMLSSLWEARTYLRRQYGLMTNRREGKSKVIAKDINKAPVRAQGINGDKFWEEVSSTMSALESEESMIAQCRAFVELLSVDQDFKVAAEADDDTERARLSTPSEDEENGTPGPPGGSGRGRKRKASNTPGGRKKRARSSSISAPRPRGKTKGTGKRASVEKSDDDVEGWE
jgi:cohesin loading factor subunit SCC2